MHTLEQKGACCVTEQARLIGITNNRKITQASTPEFWFQFQRSILLALKDSGTMTEMQYRNAEEKLKDQIRRNERRAAP